jgi:hypothetical protein
MARALAAFALALLVCQPVPAFAQTVAVSPFVGYRFGGGFFEQITNQPVDLDGATAAGGVLNVAMHDGLWFEGVFTRQQARIEVPGSALAPPSKWRVTVDHYLAGGLQEMGGTPTIRPFLTGLLGLTRYAAEGDTEVRFVVGAGGGVKLQPTRHLGARLDGRVFATFADVSGRAIICSPGICLFAFDGDVVWQAEFSAGLVLGF